MSGLRNILKARWISSLIFLIALFLSFLQYVINAGLSVIQLRLFFTLLF